MLFYLHLNLNCGCLFRLELFHHHLMEFLIPFILIIVTVPIINPPALSTVNPMLLCFVETLQAITLGMNSGLTIREKAAILLAIAVKAKTNL